MIGSERILIIVLGDVLAVVYDLDRAIRVKDKRTRQA